MWRGNIGNRRQSISHNLVVKMKPVRKAVKTGRQGLRILVNFLHMNQYPGLGVNIRIYLQGLLYRWYGRLHLKGLVWIPEHKASFSVDKVFSYCLRYLIIFSTRVNRYYTQNVESTTACSGKNVITQYNVTITT